MRRNCFACRRWLHAHDYPYATAPLCRACEFDRAWRDHGEYQRGRRARLSAMTKARRRIESGEAVWAGPLRTWLLVGDGWGQPRWARLGLDQLADWAGVDERTIQRIRDGEQNTVDVGIADGILTRAPGAPGFTSIYPLDDELLEAA